MAQLVRAPPCHGGGRRFESDLGRLYGIIAQLGEHLPYKQRVIGSSPIGPIYSNNFVIIWVRIEHNMSRVCRCGSTAEQLICNQQVIGSNPIIGFIFFIMDGFPSGQRGQTVNLLATLSKVRILPHPLVLQKWNRCISVIMARGGAAWKLVGLITRRS